jgi:hypothetical protein
MRNPLSIEAFADWCEKKPADEAYSYSNICGPCAFAQYLIHLGFPVDYVGADHWRDLSRTEHRLPDWVDEIVKDSSYGPSPSHTFGALAKRLREASRAQND